MPAPAIEVEDLHYAYRRSGGRRLALDGLSFRVERGEIFGLLGPNGAGKTTAVRILTTLLKPTSGRAVVEGFDVVREPLAARRRLAAVFQETSVEVMLSTWDNLLLYGYLHGLSREEAPRRAREVSDLLELGDYLGQRAQGLSGGYKRRLQVAKALMVETPVLFLDEATTGMDPLIKRRIVQAIHEQAARGRTVVMTTQLLDEAEQLCDRMVLMNRGTAMAAGKLSELRALSRKVFDIRLAFSEPGEEATRALRELGPRTIEDEDGEVLLVVEGSEDEWIRKMARISERFPLARFEIRGATLEEIFVELYGADDAAREVARAGGIDGGPGPVPGGPAT
ncbi:MAG: ATP-binding cassette domain-containing protein [Gemmatimonadota bacterium]